MNINKKTLSPCIKICVLHQKYNVCLGCFRKSEEIIKWTKLTKKQKLIIISKLEIRKKEFKPIRRLK